MSRIKAKAPTPVPGDDGSTPNLILSSRKIIALGENIAVELLNVPDSNEASSYRVQLSFMDENGKLVRQFDEVNFDAAKLQEHRFYLPSGKTQTQTAHHLLWLVRFLRLKIWHWSKF